MPDVKFSNQYPYTDFHELNLDWVIKEVKYWSTKVGKTIQSITLTGTVGLVDTYTINYSDGTTSTFDVTNGNGIASVAKTGTVGLVDTYTITFQDGSTTTFDITNGAAAVDPTLTLQDYAADAKATGDALDTKADDIGSYNRFNKNTVSNGIITKTGAISFAAGWVYSDYIPVVPGEIIYADMSAISASSFALFDRAKNVVSNVNNWTNPFTIPSGVSYIRVTFKDTLIDTAYISLRNEWDEFLGITPYIHDNVVEEHDERTNLIKKDTLIPNCYVKGQVDGTLATTSGFYATAYIPMKPNTQYYFNSSYLYGGYAAFYDSDYAYISGYGTKTALNYIPSPFTTPANTAYGRFTIVSASLIPNAWLCETNQMAVKPEDWKDELIISSATTKPTEYEGNEISVFTKILCIGDSLTDGFFNESGGSRLVMRNRSFPAKLQMLTGVECTNMGESGFTSAQWYSAHSGDDLSGHDACIIQLGVNDQLQNVAEATMDAALTSIINKVKTDNSGIKIFVATIIPANGYMTAAMRTRSDMIRNFVESLNDPDVYLIDMWTYGHTDDYLAYDAGHLSAIGYLRLASDYKSYISWMIRNNINDFRYVQFIGTNYTYSGDSETRTIAYT